MTARFSRINEIRAVIGRTYNRVPRFATLSCQEGVSSFQHFPLQIPPLLYTLQNCHCQIQSGYKHVATTAPPILHKLLNLITPNRLGIVGSARALKKHEVLICLTYLSCLP